MGAFLGCCVIAAAVFYGSRKIARVLWTMGVVIENDVDRRAMRDGMNAETTPLSPRKEPGKHTRMVGRW